MQARAEPIKCTLLLLGENELAFDVFNLAQPRRMTERSWLVQNVRKRPRGQKLEEKEMSSISKPNFEFILKLSVGFILYHPGRYITFSLGGW